MLGSFACSGTWAVYQARSLREGQAGVQLILPRQSSRLELASYIGRPQDKICFVWRASVQVHHDVGSLEKESDGAPPVSVGQGGAHTWKRGRVSGHSLLPRRHLRTNLLAALPCRRSFSLAGSSPCLSTELHAAVATGPVRFGGGRLQGYPTLAACGFSPSSCSI